MTTQYVLQAENNDGEIMRWEGRNLSNMISVWNNEFPESEYPYGSIFGYDENGNETYYKSLRG